MKPWWNKLVAFLTCWLCAFLTACSPARPQGEGNWQTDFDAAIKTAQTEDKLVLLSFTGSDWCGPCIRQHENVFATRLFADYASNHLSLVSVDFPRRSPQPEKIRVANNALAERFRVAGFPTIILLNGGEKELGRWVGNVFPDAPALIDAVSAAKPTENKN